MEKATRQFSKDHNKRLILRTIFRQSEISRAEIARATHLTRTTVSSIVAELIQEGLVAESGRGTSEGGKPPVLLQFQDEARHLISLDLSNSFFQGAVTDLRGRILHYHRTEFEERNGQAALEQVFALLDTLADAATRPVLGIAVGAPGLMDTQAGVIRHAVNLGWENLALRQLIQEQYPIPCHVVNDSQAAALGEYSFGCDSPSGERLAAPNLVVVKVGRGIGCGIVFNNTLYHSEGVGAGEIGHVVIVDGGEPCTCGNRGCLETVASSRSVVREARRLATQHPTSPLAQLIGSTKVVNTNLLLQVFQAGDPDLLAIITRAGTYLGIAIANIVGLLGIQRICIAGSLARFGEPYLQAIRQAIRQHVNPLLVGDTEIFTSSLGQEIVIRGAAALLLANELGI